MLTLLALEHFTLRSPHPDRLVRFYCSILGCDIEQQDPTLGLTQLRAADALIDILTQPKKDPAQESPTEHLCMHITPCDLNELRNQLVRLGVYCESLEQRYDKPHNKDALYIKDPDGNLLELVPHEEAPAPTPDDLNQWRIYH